MTPARQPPYEMQDAYILTKEKWIELCDHLTIGCTNQKAFLDSLATRTIATAPDTSITELTAINAALLKLYPEDFALHLNAKQLMQVQKEHDAQVAKAAREQVLDAIIANLESRKKEATRIEQSPCTHEKMSQRFGVARIVLSETQKFIESLRAQPEPRQEGRR